MRLKALTETDLVARSQRGDTDAYDQLVGAYQHRIFALAYRITGNREDAWDAAQEAFLKAYRNLRAFHGRAAFSTWLHRIAVNAAIDVVRRRPPHPPVSIDLPLTTLDDPADEAMRKDVQQRVHRAIAGLPNEQRVVIALRDLQGLRYDEIAAVLRVPVGTVRSRISRAREALRVMLADLAPASGEGRTA
jgi:RNA polymerase sigma-70 factor (ECF subfamily)